MEKLKRNTWRIRFYSLRLQHNNKTETPFGEPRSITLMLSCLSATVSIVKTPQPLQTCYKIKDL